MKTTVFELLFIFKWFDQCSVFVSDYGAVYAHFREIAGIA